MATLDLQLNVGDGIGFNAIVQYVNFETEKIGLYFKVLDIKKELTFKELNNLNIMEEQ